MKTALITGSRGQDGTYLSEYLQRLGYQVIGVQREPSTIDILDPASITQGLLTHQPDEIYLLAALHHSSQEKLTDEAEIYRQSNAINAQAPAFFLDAMTRHLPQARLFFAASCHVFGAPATPVQDESTPLRPEGVYGISKTAGIHLCRYYRQKHKIFASTGILYNHESPRRSPNFVSQKIVRAAVAIQRKQQDKLVLGDLDTEIDWGYAGDYVQAMHRILQLPAPDDFVISSGTKHRIRDFVEIAFDELGLDWKQYVSVDPNLLRAPTRISYYGNNTKLCQSTGWKPLTDFPTLIHQMIQAELDRH